MLRTSSHSITAYHRGGSCIVKRVDIDKVNLVKGTMRILCDTIYKETSNLVSIAPENKNPLSGACQQDSQRVEQNTCSHRFCGGILCIHNS